MSVRRSKSGKGWVVDIRLSKNERRRFVVKGEKRFAEQIEREMKINAEKYKFGFPIDKTIEELVNEYLKNSFSSKKSTTYKKDLQECKKLLNIVDSKMTLMNASKNIFKLVEDKKNEYLLLDKKSRNTVNGFLIVIKALFNKAVAWNYLQTNPLKNIKRLNITKNKHIKTLSNEEMKIIFGKCDSELLIIVKILAYTGMRIAELLFLEWDSLDFERNIISIKNTDIWTPKDYEARDLPIEKELKPVLLAHKMVSVTGIGFLIGKSCGNKELDKAYRNPDCGKIYKFYNKRFKRILKDMGIYKKGMGFHILRHTYASNCLMNGMPIARLSKLLGHSSIKTTEIYTHLDPKYLQDSKSYIYYGSTQE